MAHPATYYHYEPLLHYDIRQVRQGSELSEDALRTVRDLFNCDYRNLSSYLSYGRAHNELFSHNIRLWRHCDKGKNEFCWKASFLSRLCQLFPFQIMKTVRLRTNLTRPLLEDSSLGVKVVLLVRDPRGTMQSRRHRIWCPGNSDCDEPSILCSDLVDDYRAAQQLLKDYPNRFRYEDFSKDPVSNSESLLSFLSFPAAGGPEIRRFLDTHTKNNVGGVSSTFRDSSVAPFHWKRDLTFREVKKIQKSCSEAMRLWGYRNFVTQKDLDSNDSISFLDMNLV